jgi:hypothetical protein
VDDGKNLIFIGFLILIDRIAQQRKAAPVCSGAAFFVLWDCAIS